MAFTNDEVLWATQLALTRMQYRRSAVVSNEKLRIFGTDNPNSFFAIRNYNGEKHIFTAYIKDGKIYVKSIPMIFCEENPYYSASAWKNEYSFGAAITDVAIEFDGVWVPDEVSGSMYIVTEDVPWIFYVENGILYAQYGLSEPITLSADVIKVVALRGWVPSDGDWSNDQGLIVGYLKTDGAFYYRNYCKQVTPPSIWELERAVTPFSSMVDDISLFRANDFRVGFIAQIAGDIYWTLTTRNYAGMSVWPEQVTAAITDVLFEVYPILYVNAINEEYLNSSIEDITFLVCVPIYPALVSISNLMNEYNLKVVFDHMISGSAVGHEAKFTLTDSSAIVYTINSTYAGATANELMLACVNFASAKNPMTLTYTGGLTSNNDGCEFDIPAFVQGFTANIEPPKGYAMEYLTANIVPTFTVSVVAYKIAYETENITASIASIIFTVTKVGGNPL